MVTTASEILSVDVTTSMVAIVTVITVLVFGLVTLARPSRATITWAAAFALGMLGTYLWVGANNAVQPMLRAAASGLLIGFEPLIWVGLRLHRGARALWWPALLAVAGAPTVLALTAGSPGFQVTFRLVFLLGGVFAGLIVYELLRSKQVPRDVAMPLLLASAGFVVIAVAGAASALLGDGPSPTAQLGLLRGVNAVGTIVTCVCAAFTIALMVRGAPRGGAPEVSGTAIMQCRLDRARARQDGTWSVLDVRLDDPDDLREAFAGTVFASIAGRFHEDIQATLPASADIERIDDSRAVVLVDGSAEAIQHHLRSLLARISEIDPEVPGVGIRVSASVGWATTASCGFDLDDLTIAAGAAAAEARAEGGDRWQRVAPSPASPPERAAAPSDPLAHPTTLER